MTKTHRCSAALAACALLVGCGATEDEDVEPEHVKTWANTISAVAAYSTYEAIAFADGEATFQDPSCPTTSDDGTTVTITGGCTNNNGEQYLGVATIVRSGNDRTLTFDDYGHYEDSGSTGRGTVSVKETSPGVHSFDVDLVLTGGLTTAINYSGSVEGGYAGATSWSGSGTAERKGLVGPTGIVSATTEAEVLDDAACQGQAASGKTTIKMPEGTAVITYDGATDCDDAKAAQWSFDGEDRGKLGGIVCSVNGVGQAQNPWGLVPFAALAVALWRRRTRRLC